MIAEELGDNMMLVRVYENADHEFFSWSNQNDYMNELKGFIGGGIDVINMLRATTVIYSSMAILTSIALTMS